jgi:hypothetical protein
MAYLRTIVFIVFQVFFSDGERDATKPMGILFHIFFAKVPNMGRKILLIKITL